ncbi:hypothetical protein SAMN05443287_10334 [Micromonospora phaseoli]|uniref:Signal transduction histidine kinase n=1 Tax=Micromonospora phaseoli TaxID=1144548 RepID=A0A1H6W9K4_9ACTN|nr:hypothetical protein [Micromonospora phaseoli]PZW01668.1 hypothetical protein CLV64_10234 [Micromonospora phaseoli]GIJ80695.1 hypothetical protein Xph01_51270 [Micromonospora phaseoli]SEJ12396.1 hypothetical protein SAMN05443287_10334 [Micromonospora phaseoli]
MSAEPHTTLLPQSARSYPKPDARTTEATDEVDAARAAAAVARTSDRGARVVAVTIALVWHLVIGLPAVLAARSALAVPHVVLGGWLLVAGLGVAAGIRLLRDKPLPAPPLVGVLLLVDVVVFAAVGRGQLFSPANWVWGTLAWFFLVVLWGRPVRWLLALLAAHAATALTAVALYGATGAADLARSTMALYGTSSLPVAVFAGAAVLATLSRARAATAATTNAMVAEREAAERTRHDRRERLAFVSQAASELLTELAQGEADPTDPQVQRRCVRAATRLRRLIAESDDVPHPLLHELRAAADLAERNGLPIDLVTIGTPPSLPVPIRRSLADPLTAVLADARDWARLTVVSGPDEVVVSLVTPDRAGPDPAGHPPVDSGGQVEHLYERDGMIRWTQTRWHR